MRKFCSQLRPCILQTLFIKREEEPRGPQPRPGTPQTTRRVWRVYFTLLSLCSEHMRAACYSLRMDDCGDGHFDVALSTKASGSSCVCNHRRVQDVYKINLDESEVSADRSARRASLVVLHTSGQRASRCFTLTASSPSPSTFFFSPHAIPSSPLKNCKYVHNCPLELPAHTSLRVLHLPPLSLSTCALERTQVAQSVLVPAATTASTPG